MNNVITNLLTFKRVTNVEFACYYDDGYLGNVRKWSQAGKGGWQLVDDPSYVGLVREEVLTRYIVDKFAFVLGIPEPIKEMKMSESVILSQEVNEAQWVNNTFLRQGLLAPNGLPVHCKAAREIDGKPFLTERQLAAVKVILGRLNNDEFLGTIEVYENGGMNVFVRRWDLGSERGYKVVTYFLYREDVDPATILNTDRKSL